MPTVVIIILIKLYISKLLTSNQILVSAFFSEYANANSVEILNDKKYEIFQFNNGVIVIKKKINKVKEDSKYNVYKFCVQ